MPEIDKVICITCPKGCRLDVTREGDTILKVDNCGCKRGEEYVHAELTDPRRMVATTVKIQGSLHPLLPVYTANPSPSRASASCWRRLPGWSSACRWRWARRW